MCMFTLCFFLLFFSQQRPTSVTDIPMLADVPISTRSSRQNVILSDMDKLKYQLAGKVLSPRLRLIVVFYILFSSPGSSLFLYFLFFFFFFFFFFVFFFFFFFFYCFFFFLFFFFFFCFLFFFSCTCSSSSSSSSSSSFSYSSSSSFINISSFSEFFLSVVFTDSLFIQNL